MKATRSLLLSISIVPLLAALSGCSTAPRTAAARQDLKGSAHEALEQMETQDPDLEGFLRNSYGYAVFPHVGKGGYILGGGYGRAIVYEHGTPVGYADVTQASVGLQAGGQSFMQILAFETKNDFDRFREGKLALAANVSAVILKTGAAASAKYTDGVAVFVKPIAGAMVEASVGGQQFTYRSNG